MNWNKISLSNNDTEIKLSGRPTALKRSFENIIQNGLIYGNKVNVDIFKGNNRALIQLKMTVQVFQRINIKMFLSLFLD